MKKNAVILSIVTLFSLMFIFVTLAQAQDERGQISGAVYEDVNGDGVCVNTGIEGENPVANVPIEFVSSDEAVVLELTTGDDGTYGLVAAGQSIWRVTAKPDTTTWTVTSENPLYPPVLPETGLIQTGVNFCISKGGTGVTGNAVIILPESGASAGNSFGSLVPILALLGSSFVAVGVALEWRRRVTI